ncbi:hypothetical protein WMF45_38385 [Sorangium sp. So ce448]|uniref:hypothetical protein n=1 Tax=Sorangium sp. So ce448 TaxID=3133314 RepID=UPI003F61F8BD
MARWKSSTRYPPSKPRPTVIESPRGRILQGPVAGQGWNPVSGEPPLPLEVSAELLLLLAPPAPPALLELLEEAPPPEPLVAVVLLAPLVVEETAEPSPALVVWASPEEEAPPPVPPEPSDDPSEALEQAMELTKRRPTSGIPRAKVPNAPRRTSSEEVEVDM